MSMNEILGKISLICKYLIKIQLSIFNSDLTLVKRLVDLVY